MIFSIKVRSTEWINFLDWTIGDTHQVKLSRSQIEIKIIRANCKVRLFHILLLSARPLLGSTITALNTEYISFLAGPSLSLTNVINQ